MQINESYATLSRNGIEPISYAKVAMDPVRNPFVPGAGAPPPTLEGRAAVLERARITLERLKAGRQAKSFLLVGLRGVGKTVLLNEIDGLAKRLGCRTLVFENHEGKSLPALLVPPLRALLLQLDRGEQVNAYVKRGLRVLKGFAKAVKVKHGEIEIGLDIDPEAGMADSGDLEADLPDLFVVVAEAAKARGTSVVVIIDELQYLSEIEFSALIMAIHRICQRQLPLALIGAGLPQLVALAGRSKSYAERLFDFPGIGALTLEDAALAIAEPIQTEGASIDPAALDRIVAVTERYPYFLQEWGYHAWNVSAGPVITLADVETATDIAIRSLDESFFRVRLDRLTPTERDYLRAMADLGPGPHRSGDVADRLSRAVESVAPLRNGLIKKGSVYSPAHGDTAFTVPLFDAFMRRSIPTWTPLPRGSR